MTRVVTWPAAEDSCEAASLRAGENSVWHVQARAGTARPSMAQLATGRERGLLSVEVIEPIHPDVEEHVDLLALVRDAAALGLPVAWRLHEGTTPEAVDSLAHLPPPTEGPGGLGEWTARYRRNSYYWRLGPGFVKVFDGRVPKDARRFSIGDPDLVNAFIELHDRGEVPPALVRAASFLCEQGLAVRFATRMFIPICRLSAA